MIRNVGKIGGYEIYDVTDAIRKEQQERKRCEAEGVAYYPPEYPELKEPKIDFVEITDEFKDRAKGRRSASAAVYSKEKKGSKISNFFNSAKNAIVSIKDKYKEFDKKDKLRRIEQEKQVEFDRQRFQAMYNADPIKMPNIGKMAKKYIEHLAKGLETMFEAMPIKRF